MTHLYQNPQQPRNETRFSAEDLATATAIEDKSSKWRGPYIEGKIPPDPWGEAYQYAYPGKHKRDSYDVWSKGPDKEDGTADDIGNWQGEAAEAAK